MYELLVADMSFYGAADITLTSFYETDSVPRCYDCRMYYDLINEIRQVSQMCNVSPQITSMPRLAGARG